MSYHIRFFGTWYKAILYIGSEFESLVARPGDKVIIRKLFLRANQIVFGKKIFFGNGFRLYKFGNLGVGDRACFGENCGIYVHEDIIIGEDFIAAPGLTINSGTHDIETLEAGGDPIKIGNRVWCGVNVTVLAGSIIGDDCVIGANSLVIGTIPARSLAVGIPAKVKKREIRSGRQIWTCYSTVDPE